MAGISGIDSLSGQASYSQSKTESAKSGDIKTGAVFNISGSGSVGTVKMLAMAGIGWLLYRIFLKKGK